MEYIKSLRLPACLLTVLIVLASFKIAGLDPSSALILLPVVLLVTMAAMVINQLVDARNDLRKGLSFVWDHRPKYILFVIAVWGFAILTIGLTLIARPEFSGILLTMGLISLVYSHFRRYPFLPNILVATCVALAAALVFAVKDPGPENILFFVAVLFIIWAREIIKDIDDLPSDFGWKWTIPLVFGREIAEVFIVFFCLISVCCLLLIALGLFISPIITVGPMICLWVVVFVDSKDKNTFSKWALDLGAILAVIVILYS